jgi:hypothetical protein
LLVKLYSCPTAEFVYKGIARSQARESLACQSCILIWQKIVSVDFFVYGVMCSGVKCVCGVILNI